MPQTVITVRGEFSAHYPPERAVVKVDSVSDGPDRRAVNDAVLAAADAVRQKLLPMHDVDTGPVTSWSAGAVSVWSERPWNSEGALLPLVYHARLGLTARFSDFAALSRWVEELLGIEGVSIAGVDWSLTDARRTAVTAEVRSRAVKDAVAKASVYAQSIGLGTVTAIALADPGMLADHGAGTPPQPMMRADMAMMKSSGPELSLTPEELEVSAAVDARFLAS